MSKNTDKGYFDQVSDQLNATVVTQAQGVIGGVSANTDKGVSPSVNALDTGIKAASFLGSAAIMGLESVMVPALGALGLQGMACLPISKQLDPVMGIDVHFVTIPPSPAPVPMPHPYIGVLLRPKDFITATIASFLPPPPSVESMDGDVDAAKGLEIAHTLATIVLGAMGATVKIGGFVPRAVAGTPTISIPHIPMGAGFHAVSLPIPKNKGHAFMGSLVTLADNDPLSGGGAHLHLNCCDVGILSPHKKIGMYLPTGIITPIPPPFPILTNPIPIPISPAAAIMKKLKSSLGRFYKAKTKNLANKLHNKVNAKIKSQKLAGMVNKAICTVTGHPVDVATGMFFTDEEDFFLPGIIPFSWERTWYSKSDYQGPLGNGWHHAYDMGLVIDEEQLTFRMNDGRPIAFPLPTEKQPSFILSERLEAQKEESGAYVIWDIKEDLYYRFTEQAYDSVRLLESVSDANGFAIRFAYDGQGYLRRITDSTGNILSVTTDEAGRIVRIACPHPTDNDAELALALYRYDAQGNMIRQTNAVGDSMEFEYSGRLMTKEVWRNGLTWHFEYDGTHTGARCIHTWGDDNLYNHKLSFFEGVTDVENSLGHITHYYHKNGLVYKKTDPNGAEELSRYNGDNQLLAETDPLGNSRLYAYDAMGNLTDISDPEGGGTSAVYCKQGKLRHLPLSITDADGGTWEFKYDRCGNLIERLNPEGASTRMEYENGLLVRLTDPLGIQTRLHYDAQYNLVQTTDSRGNTTRYAYDRLGRCTAVTSPKGATQRRVFDLSGRIVQVEDFDGNTIELTYDGIDNLLRYKDNLQEVRYRYKGMWKLAGRTDSRGTVNYQYDSEEQLRAIYNEKNIPCLFTRDKAGYITKERRFDQSERTFVRNLAGQVIRETLPSGNEKDYTYDKAGRVIRIEYPNTEGETQTYAYNAAGRLTQAVCGNSAVAFKYNRLGLPVTEQADGHTIARQYNTLGQPTAMQSSSGADITYEYDTFGQLIRHAAGEWQSEFTYDSLGFETERKLNGGITLHQEYDPIGRLTRQRTASRGGTLRRVRQYRWGEGDRLKSIADSINGDTQYSYTPAGHLEHARFGNGDEQWRTADKTGNLFETKERTDRMYDAFNRMEKKGDFHYRYDADGNLVERYRGGGKWYESKKERWQYRWNPNGTLASVKRPDGETVTFAYDALGRRIAKEFKGTKTCFLWDNNVILHQWKESVRSFFSDGSEHKTLVKHNRITWLFEPESFVPCGKINEGKSYAIITDHLGTPLDMYDQNGEHVWQRELDLNGKVIKETQQGICPFRFQGMYFDEETDLCYVRHRYYSADTGAFISQDPIGLASGEYNFYSYVEDTNTWVDVLGLTRSSYATRSKASLKAMRKRFKKTGRKKFLKKLGKNIDALRRDGFSDDEIKQIQKGKVPTGYEVHHKKPLFRGGDNSFNNLDLMKKSVHKAKFKELHYYEGDTSPYYL